MARSVESETPIQRDAGAQYGTGQREPEDPDRGYVEYAPGPDRQDLSDRYGFDVRGGQARTLQRLETKFGTDQVRRWADEGMTVETMGKPRDMQAFRERQAGRPDVVPTDIERRNEASLQRNMATNPDERSAGDAGVPDVVRDVVSSPGQSLDETVQREMEDKMGEDFGDVRIHTGPQAAEAAERINARAFTVGNHVAFNRDEYDPVSSEGQSLLAHELTHVRQQRERAVSMLPNSEANLAIDPDAKLEREAEEAAQEVTNNRGTVTRTSSKIHVQRSPGTGIVQRNGPDMKFTLWEATPPQKRKEAFRSHGEELHGRIKTEFNAYEKLASKGAKLGVEEIFAPYEERRIWLGVAVSAVQTPVAAVPIVGGVTASAIGTAMQAELAEEGIKIRELKSNIKDTVTQKIYDYLINEEHKETENSKVKLLNMAWEEFKRVMTEKEYESPAWIEPHNPYMEDHLVGHIDQQLVIGEDVKTAHKNWVVDNYKSEVRQELRQEPHPTSGQYPPSTPMFY